MNKPLSKIISTLNDFQSYCSYFGIEVDNKQLDLFKKYSEILINWNEKINLVSRKMLKDEITKNTFIFEKCFLDSIVFLPEIKDQFSHAKYPASILDIGSGAGFPAIPLAIIEPKWKFTLCESTKKKTDFLNTLIKDLNLNNVSVINERVENHNGKYDVIIARAVASLDTLIKYSVPILKNDGFMAFFKAKDIDDELKEAKAKNNKLKMLTHNKEVNEILRKLVVITF